METPKSMTKYSDSSKPDEPVALHEATLEFPDGRSFVPVVNRGAPKDFIEFCSSYLPRLRQRPDYRQRRMASCCEAEFDLYHPERTPATFPAALLDELLAGLD